MMGELVRKPSDQQEFFEDDGQLMEDLTDMGGLKSEYDAICERVRRVSKFIENVDRGLPQGKRIITYTDGIATEILSRDEFGNYTGQSTLYGMDRLLPFLGDGIRYREEGSNELIVTNSELGIAIPAASVAAIIDVNDGFSAVENDDEYDSNTEYETDAFEVFASYSPKLRAQVASGEKSIFADTL